MLLATSDTGLRRRQQFLQVFEQLCIFVRCANGDAKFVVEPWLIEVAHQDVSLLETLVERCCRYADGCRNLHQQKICVAGGRSQAYIRQSLTESLSFCAHLLPGQSSMLLVLQGCRGNFLAE